MSDHKGGLRDTAGGQSGIARLTVGLALIAAGVMALAGCAATPGPAAPSGDVEELLAQVRIVPSRPDPGGYDRSCRRGHACVFGPAWTDDHHGAGGHDGCDTRNNVLAAQLRDVAHRPGSSCVVIRGTLDDPYTGDTINWTKTHASAVQVDHVYPLALAWDMGAVGWPAQRRVDFANDQRRNLLAVDARANESKGDQGPATWLPINRTFRCSYVARFLEVAIAYELPITRSDAVSVRHTARGCRDSAGGTALGDDLASAGTVAVRPLADLVASDREVRTEIRTDHHGRRR